MVAHFVLFFNSFSNGGLVKLIGAQTFKSAILKILYFVREGFQCTANGIFIPKDLKLGEISIKKAL